MLELLYEARVERQIRTTAPHRLDRPADRRHGRADLGFLGLPARRGPAAHRPAAGVGTVAARRGGRRAARSLSRAARLADGRGRGELRASRPLPIGGDFSGFWRIGGARVAKLGLRGGFFHPATGRTLADAARTALLLAEQKDFSAPPCTICSRSRPSCGRSASCTARSMRRSPRRRRGAAGDRRAAPLPGSALCLGAVLQATGSACSTGTASKTVRGS